MTVWYACVACNRELYSEGQEYCAECVLGHLHEAIENEGPYTPTSRSAEFADFLDPDSDLELHVDDLSAPELRTLVRRLLDLGSRNRNRNHDYCGVETRVTPHEDQRCSYCRLVERVLTEER
jgi:hypothetical protein